MCLCTHSSVIWLIIPSLFQDLRKLISHERINRWPLQSIYDYLEDLQWHFQPIYNCAAAYYRLAKPHGKKSRNYIFNSPIQPLQRYCRDIRAHGRTFLNANWIFMCACMYQYEHVNVKVYVYIYICTYYPLYRNQRITRPNFARTDQTI